MKNGLNYERVGRLLCAARSFADMTQAEVAKEMKVSLKTIQNWENGITSPSLPNMLEYFDILGINPISYIEGYIHPDTPETVLKDVEDEDVMTHLSMILQDLTVKEARDLIYILRGNHGSSPYAILQEMVANLHTTIGSRHVVAEVIRSNYEREEARGELVCLDNIKPDMNALSCAISGGKNAAMRGHYGYV